MNFSIFLVLEMLLVLGRLNSLLGDAVTSKPEKNASQASQLRFIPFSSLVDASRDTSEFWRATEILSLVQTHRGMMESFCKQEPAEPLVRLPSRRTVNPICRGPADHQLCPQCAHMTNQSECELFRDSCREPPVSMAERSQYCDRKYGRGRTVLYPADYSRCRCCDECVPYRELDQSCEPDVYDFEMDEILPVTSTDFRAGCNPYWGHRDQELRALRCDKVLRRCVPNSAPAVAKQHMPLRHGARFEPLPPDAECPLSCRGYLCKAGLVDESLCKPGAFLPDKETCNCCGRCSDFQQLNEKCAVLKKTVHDNNGTQEVEVEEEILEPGCDDGLVCRQGYCQDIHGVQSADARRRGEPDDEANEPCKRELKLFKKKYGPDGHLHYNAPQCTPLWLYAPVQCRGFVCHCALEDGTFVHGIKVPRVEVSNMNCDCAREKCRTGSDIECDGYGNYKEAVFTPHAEDKNTSGGDSGSAVLTDRLHNAVKRDIEMKSLWDFKEFALHHQCPFLLTSVADLDTILIYPYLDFDSEFAINSSHLEGHESVQKLWPRVEKRSTSHSYTSQATLLLVSDGDTSVQEHISPRTSKSSSYYSIPDSTSTTFKTPDYKTKFDIEPKIFYQGVTTPKTQLGFRNNWKLFYKDFPERFRTTTPQLRVPSEHKVIKKAPLNTMLKKPPLKQLSDIDPVYNIFMAEFAHSDDRGVAQEDDYEYFDNDKKPNTEHEVIKEECANRTKCTSELKMDRQCVDREKGTDNKAIEEGKSSGASQYGKKEEPDQHEIKINNNKYVGTRASHKKNKDYLDNKTYVRSSEPDFKAAMQQDYKAAMQRDYKAAMQRDYKASMQRDYEAASQQDHRPANQQDYKAAMQQDYKAATQRDYKAATQRDYKAAMQQDYKAAMQRDYKAAMQRDYEAAMQRDYEAAMQQNYKAAMQQDYKAAMQQDYKAVTQRDYKAAMQQDYKAAMQQDYKAATQRDYKAAIQRDYKAAMQQDYKAAMQQDYKAVTQRDYKAATQRDYKAAMQQDYKAATQQDYKAAMQRDYKKTIQRDYEAAMQQDYKKAIQRDYKAAMQQDYEAAMQKDYNATIPIPSSDRLNFTIPHLNLNTTTYKVRVGPKLKVFVVPFSHNVPGWLYTFEAYFRSKTQHIIDNVLAYLIKYPKLTFIWSEISLLVAWWKVTTARKRQTLKELVSTGRFEIVAGGWVMPDEACTHYYPLIDQFIEGHQWVKSTLGISPRSGWSIAPFGHGPTVPYILQNSGITGTVIQRINYAWKRWLVMWQVSEFHWLPGWAASEAPAPAPYYPRLVVHYLPFSFYDINNSCGPDPVICARFDFSKYPDNKETLHNISHTLIEQYRVIGALTPHNVALVPLGGDFKYTEVQELEIQYENYMEMFNYINSHQEIFNTEVQFGTVSDFFQAIKESHKYIPTLKGDFFPYADKPDSFWSGFFTSRPLFKLLSRQFEHQLRTSEIMFSLISNILKLTNTNLVASENLYGQLVAARRSLGLFQHHDAVTGTSRAFVMKDYERRILKGISQCLQMQQKLLTAIMFPIYMSRNIVESSLKWEVYKKPVNVLNVLRLENKLIVFNPLAEPRTDIVTLQSSSPFVRIYDTRMNTYAQHQIGPSFHSKHMNEGVVISTSEFEVMFVASLPALAVVVFNIMQDFDKSAHCSVICDSCNTSNYIFTVTPLYSSDEKLRLENSFFKLYLSNATGFLRKIYRKDVKRGTEVYVQFGVYENNGSGAYLFRINRNEQQQQRKKHFWDYHTKKKTKRETIIIKGPIASTVRTYHLPILTHVMTIFKVESAACSHGVFLENLVDFNFPPLKHNIDLFMRIQTDIRNGEPPEFYTDQNGFQYQKRVRLDNVNTEGNIYPVTTMAWLQDANSRLTVLTDRAQGVSARAPGRLELMLGRTTSDDHRGLDEGVTETKVFSQYWLLLEPVNVPSLPKNPGHKRPETRADAEPPLLSFQRNRNKGKSQVYELPSETAGHLSRAFNYPVQVYSVNPADGNSDELIPFQSFAYGFPAGLHLVTLRTMTHNYKHPNSAFLMLLYRPLYSCHVGNMSNAWAVRFAKYSGFTGLSIAEVSSASLTGLHEHGLLSGLAEIQVDPLEIGTFKVTLNRYGYSATNVTKFT